MDIKAVNSQTSPQFRTDNLIPDGFIAGCLVFIIAVVMTLVLGRRLIPQWSQKLKRQLVKTHTDIELVSSTKISMDTQLYKMKSENKVFYIFESRKNITILDHNENTKEQHIIRRET